MATDETQHRSVVDMKNLLRMYHVCSVVLLFEVIKPEMFFHFTVRLHYSPAMKKLAQEDTATGRTFSRWRSISAAAALHCRI